MIASQPNTKKLPLTRHSNRSHVTYCYIYPLMISKMVLWFSRVGRVVLHVIEC